MLSHLLRRLSQATTSARLPLVEALDGRQLCSASPTTIIVPAYFYPTPGGDWDRMATAAKSAPITAILNPNSGPDKKADPVYQAAVDKLRASSGKVVGYVSTGYGSRSLAKVEADVLAYTRFYHMDGIFVDEMASDDAHLPYYRSLYAYIKKLSSRLQVIGNPGTGTRESYLNQSAADVLMDFEDNQSTFPTTPPPTWAARHQARNFANIVGKAATAQTMRNDLLIARQHRVGYVFFTDQNINDDSTAYTRLPKYWADEVAAVKAANAQGTVQPHTVPWDSPR